MKEKFLNNEIWVLTFGGGFQRANIYKEEVPSTVRKDFRMKLRNYIEALVKENYSFKITEEDHIENILSIVNFSKKHKFEGFNIPINFGVAQKLLNLYLKYLWCAGKLETTPIHFPVDRIMQEILNKEALQLGFPKNELKPWTKYEDEVEYLKMIRLAESVRQLKYNDLSLAEMELEIFARR